MTVAKQLLDFCAKYMIRFNLAAYAVDRTPFHAWDAYRWARRSNKPIPEWVLAYFDRCAERLEQTKPTTPKEIAKTFEMVPDGGGPSFAKRAKTTSERLSAVQSAWSLEDLQPGMKKEEIFARVAEERGLSEEYVRNAYYNFPKKAARRRHPQGQAKKS